MNEMTTYRWSFEEDVEHYRQAGIPAIGVWRQKLSDFGEEKGVELLAESGLAVSNLLWGGGFTGSDGRTFRDSVDDALEAVRLAGSLRADCLVLYTGARAGHTHNHARRILRDALKELLPAAAEQKVSLALEPMHESCGEEWTFLHSLDDALPVLEAFPDGQVGLVLDTYHLGWDERFLNRVADIAARVKVVHLGDGKLPPGEDQNRCPLGTGALPLRATIQALEGAGYRGRYDVELLGEDLEASNYRELLEQSKAAFARLVAPA
jgi:sugar phosphate isomerase/epimerase